MLLSSSWVCPQFLWQVVGAGVGVLSPGDVHNLAAFLAARLVDWWVVSLMLGAVFRMKDR